MNNPVTSREEILSHCRQLVKEKGMDAIQMRSVASACGVALGSLYNYFPSKAALTLAVVESVWTDIFFGTGQHEPFDSFLTALDWLYERFTRAGVDYPGFLSMHPFSFAHDEMQSAREHMQHHQSRILQRLLAALRCDPQIKKDAFDESFTPEHLVPFAFQSIMASAQMKDGDMIALRRLIQRTLY